MIGIFENLPDDILEKIYLINHKNFMNNVIIEINKKDGTIDFSDRHNKIRAFKHICRTNDNRFLIQNVMFYIVDHDLWNNVYDKQAKTLFVSYWLNNITLCKYIYGNDYMLKLFKTSKDILKYIKLFILKKTHVKEKPLKQFNNIYLKKIGYNGKYINSWTKAIEILWSI